MASVESRLKEFGINVKEMSPEPPHEVKSKWLQGARARQAEGGDAHRLDSLLKPLLTFGLHKAIIRSIIEDEDFRPDVVTDIISHENCDGSKAGLELVFECGTRYFVEEDGLIILVDENSL